MTDHHVANMLLSSDGQPTTTLHTLPVEIQQQILSSLPLATLLTFARTSNFNYRLATSTLTTLQVAVFPKRMHGTLAFLNDNAEDFLLEEGRRCVALGVCDGHDKFDQKRKQQHPQKKTLTKKDDSRTTALIPTNTLTSAGTSSREGSPPLTTGAGGPTPHQLRHFSIHSQNARLTEFLLTPSITSSPFHTLKIHTTALLSTSLAQTLASSFPHLRNLTLNFSHPYVTSASSRVTFPFPSNFSAEAASPAPTAEAGAATGAPGARASAAPSWIDTLILPRNYWKLTPSIPDEGSPSWNFLAGIGHTQSQNLRLTGLRELNIVRAAITSFQLREWVTRNPDLTSLRLEMVSGVDAAFCEALGELAETQDEEDNRQGKSREGETKRRRAFKKLIFENCQNLQLTKAEDFQWVDELVENGLEELSFSNCEGVNVEMLKTAKEVGEWERKGLMKFGLPNDDDEEDDNGQNGEQGRRQNSSGGRGRWRSGQGLGWGGCRIGGAQMVLEVDPACA